MGKKNIAFINKDMLVWARSETPFVSPEMVEMKFPAMKSEKIISWENGDDYPSVNEAKKLASIYRVPFACFFLTNAPEKKPRNYTDRRTSRGSVYSEISYTLWSEIQRITSNRETLIEYKTDDSVFDSIPTSSASNEEAIALIIREFLNLKTPLKTKSAYGGSSFNFFRNILERNGIIVSQISGVSLEEMKGLSIYFDEFPIIAINNKDYDNSKVFSLFHELAHIFRRSSSLCLIDFEERDDEEEKICDRIAAETLMPKSEFISIATTYIAKYTPLDSACLSRIAGRFGVSSFSVLMRLKELSIVSDNEYFDLLDTIKEEYEMIQEKLERDRKGKNIPIDYHIKYLNQNGYILPRIMMLSYAAGSITLGEVCKALNVGSNHISSIEQAVMLK